MPSHVPGSLGFGRKKRLRWSAEFARIKLEGKRIAKGCLIGNWVQQAGRNGEPLRLGVITPKNVGPSVARARARRLLREVFRVHQHSLAQPLSLVLVARPSIAGRSFADVERDYLNLIRQGNLLAKE